MRFDIPAGGGPLLNPAHDWIWSESDPDQLMTQPYFPHVVVSSTCLCRQTAQHSGGQAKQSRYVNNAWSTASDRHRASGQPGWPLSIPPLVTVWWPGSGEVMTLWCYLGTLPSLSLTNTVYFCGRWPQCAPFTIDSVIMHTALQRQKVLPPFAYARQNSHTNAKRSNRSLR